MKRPFSSFWQRLLRDLGLQDDSHQIYQFDDLLMRSMQNLAEREQRSEDEIAAVLLSSALAQRDAADASLEVWRTLTPRQQQVAALACLDYTNRQVAGRLKISPETVKTHMRHVLRKFDLRNKIELQRALAGWDFSAWLEP